MTGRWRKGTNDHDGDGRKGGSISAAEAERRNQEESDMTSKKNESSEGKPAPLSNHNTTDLAKPVPVQQVKDMPDYNPARPDSPGEVDDEVVAEKGDRPSPAETDNANAFGEPTPASNHSPKLKGGEPIPPLDKNKGE